MTPAAEIASVPVPATRVQLRDFSDRFSPMLVKELRQGLKSPVFVWGLIVMQMVLAVMAVVTMDAGESRETAIAFWWPVAGIICILLPMRVANALRDEMSGNTMDTLVLTQLSAWRITLGKWLATGALQILVAVTVLPYLILRYFAGGVNLPVEMACMGVFVVFGLLITAIMLGLSWFRYFLIRAAVMLAIVFGAVMGCSGLLYMIVRINRYLPDLLKTGWPALAWILMMAAWVGFFFLDLGVAQIAPVSENRATRRRLAVLLLLVIGGAGALMVKEAQAGMVLAAMLSTAAGIAGIQALCERPANFAPVLKPFVKRGAAGRLAGRVLYPGWHSGLFFTLLLWIAAPGLMIYLYTIVLVERMAKFGRATNELPVVLCMFGGFLGAILLPLIIWYACRVMPRWNFWRWLLVLVFAGLLHGAIMIAADKTSPSVARANLVLPGGGLFVPVIASMEAREEWRKIQAEELKRQLARLAQGLSKADLAEAVLDEFTRQSAWRYQGWASESELTKVVVEGLKRRFAKSPDRPDDSDLTKAVTEELTRQMIVKSPSLPGRVMLSPSGRPPLSNDWEERRRLEEKFTAELSVYAFTSLAVWLGAAVFMALREMRNTRRAEDELAVALAGQRHEEAAS
ncbi:MAG TPA: hypothetical protein VG796_23460 [Verrucomicrobiales bacterium]|nr:hypothetical protein [Verrucomicrobiales bacterium]